MEPISHLWHLSSNTGIKHDFLCINICWTLREVLKPEPSAGPRGRCWNPSLKGDGFNTSRGAQQMLMYQKSMFECYYCIKTFFLLENVAEIASKSSFFLPYNGTEMHGTCTRFENTTFRAKTNAIATVHLTDDDISFYDGPGMLIRKTAKLCINSTWIALLIHGFVPVQTWLLIAYDTAFYAINSLQDIRQNNWTMKYRSLTHIHFIE